MLSFIGQIAAGYFAHAENLRAHDLPPISLITYFTTGQFVSATFENWESEFLQMALYVILTAVLIQKGSPESRSPDEEDDESDDPPSDGRVPRNAPWPVHRGGLLLKLYSHSLGTALVALFLISFVLYWLGSSRKAAEEALAHHQPAPTIIDTITGAEFWYESVMSGSHLASRPGRVCQEGEYS
ncbi:DUF6766 family protein, partial [Streptomyces albidoflavus]|uniref:DUF6766 family protein n=1 Tax=Streptomyces albidoflavus TaxID=1886 RepID=UPI003421F134